MGLSFIRHEKISLKKQSQFNEAWLHDRICDDPTLLGLGDVRVLDRERAITGAGQLEGAIRESGHTSGEQTRWPFANVRNP
jgi:hypothetical protein